MLDAIKARAKRSWLPNLPRPLLTAILRRRPYLFDALPAEFVVRWPYYLGDVSVFVERQNAIERSMLSGIYEIARFLTAEGYRMCDLYAAGRLVDVDVRALPANTIGVPA